MDMMRLIPLLALVGSFQLSAAHTTRQAPTKEARIKAETAQRQFDENVLRTLKDIQYEEQRAGPGLVFSLASLEVENCTELCQGGNYLEDSCSKDCRVYFAIQRAKEEIRFLQQAVIEQNQQYEKRMRSVIIVFPIVIVILVALNQIQGKRSDKHKTEEFDKKLNELKKEMEAKIQDDLSNQRIHAHPGSDQPRPEQPLLEKDIP